MTNDSRSRPLSRSAPPARAAATLAVGAAGAAAGAALAVGDHALDAVTAEGARQALGLHGEAAKVWELLAARIDAHTDGKSAEVEERLATALAEHQARLASTAEELTSALGSRLAEVRAATQEMRIAAAKARDAQRSLEDAIAAATDRLHRLDGVAVNEGQDVHARLDLGYGRALGQGWQPLDTERPANEPTSGHEEEDVG